MPGLFNIGLGTEGEFQIAGAEVADGGDVAGEAIFGDRGRIGVFDEDEEIPGFGMDFHAGEVFQTAEGEVKLEGFHFHLVAHFEDHGFEGVKAVGQFLVGLGEAFRDGLVGACFGNHDSAATRACTAARAAITSRCGGGAVDEVQGEQVIAILGVANQLDVALHLADGVEIVYGEVAGDAEEARAAPVDVGGLVGSDFLGDEKLEIAAVVEQPIEVEESLVDDVGVGGLPPWI